MNRRNALTTIADKLEAIEKILRNHIDAISSAEKRNTEKKDKPTEIRGEIWFPENIEKNRAAEQTGQHTTQRWIARGTWAATIAAALYAGIAAYQTCLLHTANERAKAQWEAEHRPWVGTGEIEVKDATFYVYPTNPIEDRTQVNLTIDIPIKNAGISPAFHVDTEVSATAGKTISGPDTLDKLMERACSRADGNSKDVGGVLFPNSPETTVKMGNAIGIPFIQVGEVRRIFVTVCIVYSGTTSGQDLHHTKIWVASYPMSRTPTEIGRNGPETTYSVPVDGWSTIKTEAD